jgi:hypothetical protein
MADTSEASANIMVCIKCLHVHARPTACLPLPQRHEVLRLLPTVFFSFKLQCILDLVLEGDQFANAVAACSFPSAVFRMTFTFHLLHGNDESIDFAHGSLHAVDQTVHLPRP